MGPACALAALPSKPWFAAQLLNKAGLLSVPSWYAAGKVAQEGSSIPFGVLRLPTTLKPSQATLLKCAMTALHPAAMT